MLEDLLCLSCKVYVITIGIIILAVIIDRYMEVSRSEPGLGPGPGGSGTTARKIEKVD